jgi:hypothetical protein
LAPVEAEFRDMGWLKTKNIIFSTVEKA